jgi:tetratricopeptide (TPR) repeat protein
MDAYQNGQRAMEEGDFTAARSAFRWAVGLDPSNPIYTHAAAMAAVKAGRLVEAETLFRRAISDTLAALGPSHPHLVTVAHGLAELCERQGRVNEAHMLCRQIVADTDPNIAEMANSRVLRRFAELCHRAGVPGAALALYRRAIAFRCRLYGSSHALIAEYLTGLSELHSSMGNDAKASAVRNRVTRLAQAAGKSGNAGRRDSPRTAG